MAPCRHCSALQGRSDEQVVTHPGLVWRTRLEMEKISQGLYTGSWDFHGCVVCGAKWMRQADPSAAPRPWMIVG